jgi:hypothetical protein
MNYGAKTLLFVAFFLSAALLQSCSTAQVDTTPANKFADRQYQSFGWKTDLPTGVSGSMDAFYRLSSTVRDVVSAHLTKKGYRLTEAGADFVISYEFKATLEGGVDNSARGVSNTSAVINRSPDPAVVDNAYALSGPREVASLIIHFEDGGNLAPVWSATISQVVENRNQPDVDKVRQKLEPGVARAFRTLPNATGR